MTKFGHDPAAVEDEGPVANLRDLLEISRDNQDRRAGLEGDVEQFVDLDPRPDVDAGGRVTEDVDLAADVEPTPDDDLLLIAAGEKFDWQVGIVRP